MENGLETRNQNSAFNSQNLHFKRAKWTKITPTRKAFLGAGEIFSLICIPFN
jgi:hypothetical protein